MHAYLNTTQISGHTTALHSMLQRAVTRGLPFMVAIGINARVADPSQASCTGSAASHSEAPQFQHSRASPHKE